MNSTSPGASNWNGRHGMAADACALEAERLLQIRLFFFESLLAPFFGLRLTLLGLLVDGFGLLIVAGYSIELGRDFAVPLGLVAFRQHPRLLANVFDAVRTVSLLVIGDGEAEEFSPFLGSERIAALCGPCANAVFSRFGVRGPIARSS